MHKSYGKILLKKYICIQMHIFWVEKANKNKELIISVYIYTLVTCNPPDLGPHLWVRWDRISFKINK